MVIVSTLTSDSEESKAALAKEIEKFGLKLAK